MQNGSSCSDEVKIARILNAYENTISHVSAKFLELCKMKMCFSLFKWRGYQACSATVIYPPSNLLFSLVKNSTSGNKICIRIIFTFSVTLKQFFLKVTLVCCKSIIKHFRMLLSSMNPNLFFAINLKNL